MSVCASGCVCAFLSLFGGSGHVPMCLFVHLCLNICLHVYAVHLLFFIFCVCVHYCMYILVCMRVCVHTSVLVCLMPADGCVYVCSLLCFKPRLAYFEKAEGNDEIVLVPHVFM